MGVVPGRIRTRIGLSGVARRFVERLLPRPRVVALPATTTIPFIATITLGFVRGGGWFAGARWFNAW